MAGPLLDRSARIGYESGVAGIPVVGGLVESATEQARLIANLPNVLKQATDAITAFAQTVAGLDKLVKRLDRLTEPLLDPLEQIAPRLERLVPLIVPILDEIDDEFFESTPEMLDVLRTKAIPALVNIAATQDQVKLISEAVERIMGGLDEVMTRLGALPGAGLLQKRLASKH